MLVCETLSLTDLPEFLVLHLQGQQGTLEQLLRGGALVRVVAQELPDDCLLKAMKKMQIAVNLK